VAGRLCGDMGKTLRVPEPVYSKATRQAEREDVARGVIVKQWMEDAEKYEQMEALSHRR